MFQRRHPKMGVLICNGCTEIRCWRPPIGWVYDGCTVSTRYDESTGSVYSGYIVRVVRLVKPIRLIRVSLKWAVVPVFLDLTTPGNLRQYHRESSDEQIRNTSILAIELQALLHELGIVLRHPHTNRMHL